MKRLHSLLMTVLCLLSACDPSPPPPTTGLVELGPGSLRISELLSSNTLFPDQKVCGTSEALMIKVFNDSAQSRQIFFAGTTAPFVLTDIQDKNGSIPGLPFSLSAQEELTFLVRFSPLTPAQYTGDLTVFSDDPKTSTLEIPLSGKATGPRLELSPPSLTLSLPTETSDAGTSASSVSGTVLLKNGGNQQLTSLALGSVIPSFSTQLTKTVLEPGETADLVVTFAPTTSEPFFTDTLVVTSDDPCSPQTRIPLSGFRTPDPMPVVSPTALAFPEQEVGTLSEPQLVTLTNEGGALLTVDTVSIQGAPDAGTPFVVSLSGKFELKPGQSRDLSVRFAPKAAGHQQATLQFISNSNATEPIASVLLSGKAVAPVVVVSSPSNLHLSFGTQAPDTVTTKQVTLMNSGDTVLTLKDIVPADPTHFKLQGLIPPRTVEPGASLTFDVIFNPKSLGLKETTLLFYVGTSDTPLASPQLKLDGISSGPYPFFNPNDTLDFGPQRFGEPSAVSNTIEITNDQSASETLRLVSISLQYSTPEFTLGDTYAGQEAVPGGYLKVDVKFKPTAEISYSNNLLIEYMGTTTQVRRTQRIQLKGQGATALLQVASSLSFGDVELNQTRNLKLVLTNTGKATLRLNSIEGLTGTAFLLGQLDWPKDVAPGAHEEISLSFQPTTLDATTADLVITSNATSSNVVSGKTTVRLSGRGAAARALFERTALGFGEVPIGQSRLLPLRITNTGSAPLQVHQPNPSSHFRVKEPAGGWSSVRIPVQGEGVLNYLDFEIEFTPDSELKVAESILFTSNDPNTPTGVEVFLEGLGTRPKMVTWSSLYFGKGGGTDSQPLTARLPIQNQGKAPLVIRTVTVTPPFCVVLPSTGECIQNTSDFALTLGWQQQQELELRVMPTTKEPGSISITTNEGAGDEYKKSVALLVEVDDVFVQGEPLDFGNCITHDSPMGQVKGVNLANTATNDDAVIRVDITGLDQFDFSTVGTLPLDIPGNGGAELKLSFKPGKGVAGQRMATAHIHTKNRNEPLELDLKGCAADPFSGFKDFREEVDFGRQRLLKEGEPEKEPERLSLQNDTSQTIFVKGFHVSGSQPEHFHIHVDELFCRRDPTTQHIEIKPGETCYLDLSYVATAPVHSSAALDLAISMGDTDPRNSVARVRLKGELVSSILSVDPTEVDFGEVDMKKALQSRELTVTNPSQVATQVRILELTNPESFTVEGLESDTEIPPGGSTTLRVTFHPTQGGDITGELRLSLQGEQVPDVTIGLRGKVWAIEDQGGGFSCGASGGGPLLAGWLLLVALGARRRSSSASS